MKKSEALAEQKQNKRKDYLKLLKKLLDIKLHNKFENTREDKLADLRINLELIEKMAGKERPGKKMVNRQKKIKSHKC